MENNKIKELLQRFKKFCLERDLTLEVTARALKMSHSAVANLWNGIINKPHERTLYKIKKFMGEK